MTDCRAVGDWLLITEAPVAHSCPDTQPCEAKARALHATCK